MEAAGEDRQERPLYFRSRVRVKILGELILRFSHVYIAGKYRAHAPCSRLRWSLDNTYAAAAGAHRRLTAFNSVKLHKIARIILLSV